MAASEPGDQSGDDWIEAATVRLVQREHLAATVPHVSTSNMVQHTFHERFSVGVGACHGEHVLACTAVYEHVAVVEDGRDVDGVAIFDHIHCADELTMKKFRDPVDLRNRVHV